MISTNTEVYVRNWISNRTHQMEFAIYLLELFHYLSSL